ncbi:MAG: transposase family protein [Firmicutes bacterium]|nr:transposase family protein [Bacillota bacterium]
MLTGSKLTRKMEAAIAALLVAPTIADAAAVVGVHEQSLWRWLQREDFQERYREAKRQAVNQAVALLQQACSEAVETLRRIMADDEATASARVAAARTVLEMGLKAVEVEELEARITAIERQVLEKTVG